MHDAPQPTRVHDPALDALRQALADLSLAERDRARAWALAGSGLLDPPSQRAARLEAERKMEAARERVRQARSALGPATPEEKAWGGH